MVSNQKVGLLGHHQQDYMTFQVLIKDDNQERMYTAHDIRQMLISCIDGYESTVSVDNIMVHVQKNLFDGMTLLELEKILYLSVAPFIELDNAYSFIAARLLLRHVYHEVVGTWADKLSIVKYQNAFVSGIRLGVEQNIFDPKMLDFDLDFLAKNIDLSYDLLFKYLGLQTLSTRYLKKYNNVTFELPQAFWMRIAMGLALHEQDKNQTIV